MIPFYPGRSLSHLLILVMIVVSIIGFMDSRIIAAFGFVPLSLSIDTLPALLARGVAFQFLHGDIIHLLLNSFFLYQAGPEVESRMSRQRFIYFFVASTVFVSISLLMFTHGITIGMSGFCMALLAYLGIDLYTTRHPMANQIIIMLVINIGIGLAPGISFVGHLAGALFGVLWWQFFKTWKR